MKNKNKNTEVSVSNPLIAMQKQHIFIKIAEMAFLVALLGAGAANAHASTINPENIKTQINYQRELRGLKPLREDVRLDRAALAKSKDMINRDYFEHYAFGLTPWTFINNQNYNYLYAGENLAMDFETTEGMVNAWMSSPTHRKNILNPDFDEIGVGVVKGEYTDASGSRETIMVDNMFGKEKPRILQLFDSVVSRFKSIF